MTIGGITAVGPEPDGSSRVGFTALIRQAFVTVDATDQSFPQFSPLMTLAGIGSLSYLIEADQGFGDLYDVYSFPCDPQSGLPILDAALGIGWRAPMDVGTGVGTYTMVSTIAYGPEPLGANRFLFVPHALGARQITVAYYGALSGIA